MSEHQRRTVESAIQSLSSVRDGGQGRALNSSSDTTEAAEKKLISLGFKAEDVRKATTAVAPGTKVSLTELLDWMCLHLPEHCLPASFTSGAFLGFCLRDPNLRACTDGTNQACLGLIGRCHTVRSAACRLQSHDNRL